MTAPLGAEVGIYVDLVASVAVGDIIETRSGRRYGVMAVRVQARGKHAGRQHLRAVVVEPTADHKIVAMQNGDSIDISHVPTTVHRIRWYKRAGSAVSERGTCVSCGVEQDVVCGKVAEHERDMFRARIVAGPRNGEVITERDRCPGSGKSTKEARAKALAKSRARSQGLVDAVRVDAGIANDIIQAGRPMPDTLDLPKLLKLALLDLWIKWTRPPTRDPMVSLDEMAARQQASSSVPREPWLWARRGKRSSRGRARVAPTETGDIYCRFCGEPIVMRVLYDVILQHRCGDDRYLFPGRVLPHTTPCALQCLAGMRQPVAPGTRRLPEEFREDAE